MCVCYVRRMQILRTCIGNSSMFEGYRLKNIDVTNITVLT